MTEVLNFNDLLAPTELELVGQRLNDCYQLLRKNCEKPEEASSPLMRFNLLGSNENYALSIVEREYTGSQKFLVSVYKEVTATKPWQKLHYADCLDGSIMAIETETILFSDRTDITILNNMCDIIELTLSPSER